MSGLDKRLADLRDRSEKATPGPWEYDAHAHLERGCRCMSCYGAVTVWQTRNMRSCDETPTTQGDPQRCESDGYTYADAEFIAHARTDLDDLRGAVEDVLALHHRRAWTWHQDSVEFGQTEFPDQCDSAGCHNWPCPTVAAITARLGGA
jgi:hypothetical protein